MSFTNVAIRTGNLLLREFTPNDFESFLAATCHSEYQQYYPEHETSRPFIRSVFDNILSFAEQPTRTKFQLAVCLNSGEFIGTCGVRVEDIEHQQASFGCAIARDFWGKTYAWEASRSILDFAFSSLTIHRVYAETNGENWRARKLAERLGMRLEAVFKESKYFRNQWWDTAVYAVLREEWIPNLAAKEITDQR
jgi:RimJ/RimL family protein N-acetyltransferase